MDIPGWLKRDAGFVAISAMALNADIKRSILALPEASADTPVGYPMVNVRDIESGKVKVTRELFGAD
jgi:hypothetical protein